jgi:hypothetical protein
VSSVYLTGTVAGTYHGLVGFPDDPANPQQVVVTVQIQQGSRYAPLVKAVLWCGAGEAGERRAAEVRRAMVRGTLVCLVGKVITYCARSNTLNVRGLEFVNTSPDDGSPLHFENRRPETPEPTTTP